MYKISVSSRSEEEISRIVAHALTSQQNRNWLFQMGQQRANGAKEVEKLSRFYHSDSQYSLDDVPSRYPMDLVYTKKIPCKRFASHPTCLHEIYGVKATRTSQMQRLLPGKFLKKHSSKVFTCAKYVLQEGLKKGARLIVPGLSEVSKGMSALNQSNKASSLYSDANTLARVIRFVDDKMGNLDEVTKQTWKLWDDIDKSVLFYLHIITPYQIAENKGDDAKEKPFSLACFSDKSFVHIEAMKPFINDFDKAVTKGLGGQISTFIKGDIMRKAGLSYGYGLNFHLNNQAGGDKQLDKTVKFGTDLGMYKAGVWVPMKE